MVGYARRIEEWEVDFIYLAYPIFSNRKIAKYLGRVENTIAHYGSRFKLRKIKPIYPNDVFGRLTVLDEFISAKHGVNELKKWKCRCKCGREVFINQSYLLHAKVTSCGCWTKRENGTEHIPNWFFYILLEGAKIRNIPVEIDINDLENQLIKQNFKCALTNLPLIIRYGPKKESRKKCNASVDRTDNTKPYTKDNIQFLHVSVNLMKSSFTQEYFVYLCHLISQNTNYIEDKDFAVQFKKEKRFATFRKNQ